MTRQDYDLPASEGPAPSYYEAFFGDQTQGFQTPQEQMTNQNAIQNASQRFVQSPNLPPAPTPSQSPAPVVKYPDLDQFGNPISQENQPVPTPPPTEGQGGEQPNVLKVKLPSGYEVEMSPEEIQRTYLENKELQEKAQSFESFLEWSRSHPAEAQKVTAIIQGQHVEGPSTPSNRPSETPGGDDLGLGDDLFGEPGESREVVELKNKVNELSMSLQEIQRLEQERADRMMLDQVNQRLENAINSHPFAKAADEETKKAIAELALIDVRRYENEGVTHEKAVTKWANHFEKMRRASLTERYQEAQNRPGVPPEPGPGVVVPRPAPPPPSQAKGGFFDSGMFRNGIRQALLSAREKLQRGENQ